MGRRGTEARRKSGLRRTSWSSTRMDMVVGRKSGEDGRQHRQRGRIHTGASS